MAATAGVAQESSNEPQAVWQVDLNEESGFFGPAVWTVATQAELSVYCHPDPDSFDVTVLWTVGKPLAGTERSGELTELSLKFDDGRVETEKWRSLVRVYQQKVGDEADDFVQRLLAASELTVWADFADDVRHTATFALAGLEEAVGQIVPHCSRLSDLNVDDRSKADD